MGLQLVKRYCEWKDRRFLKKHGCKTWAQYNKQYDPDYNLRASRIRDFYHGYPYIYCFDNYKHYAYQKIGDYGPGGIITGIDEIQKWVSNNTKNKTRFDFLRVIKVGAVHLDNTTSEEWWINEIGGGDLIFVAFKEERDYLIFSLRWA